MAVGIRQHVQVAAHWLVATPTQTLSHCTAQQKLSLAQTHAWHALTAQPAVLAAGQQRPLRGTVGTGVGVPMGVAACVGVTDGVGVTQVQLCAHWLAAVLTQRPSHSTAQQKLSSAHTHVSHAATGHPGPPSAGQQSMLAGPGVRVAVGSGVPVGRGVRVTEGVGVEHEQLVAHRFAATPTQTPSHSTMQQKLSSAQTQLSHALTGHPAPPCAGQQSAPGGTGTAVGVGGGVSVGVAVGVSVGASVPVGVRIGGRVGVGVGIPAGSAPVVKPLVYSPVKTAGSGLPARSMTPVRTLMV